MKRIIIFGLALIALWGCQQKQQHQQATQEVSETAVTAAPVTLLDSLTFGYVTNVSNADDLKMLMLYDKTPEQYRQDSILYFTAVNNFFAADSSVLDQLMAFEGDTTRCNWIAAPSPYSSYSAIWFLDLNKSNGAKLLMHAYIMRACGGPAAIPNASATTEVLLDKLDMKKMVQWVKANQGISREQLCKKYKLAFGV
ncbi:hypothetical protein [Chitinophaga sp. sic0106]|uniref:hypothetical protein n=1 Tax=Chitinophaga sp. sic0106 TaxID=2854785 RepID=UPI001C488D74|nr:hypothetical protein [Chitinophaga sp. sic0106]MBV7531172.1 hypothetical protein [Chitinophaga sp. sic0106]